MKQLFSLLFLIVCFSCLKAQQIKKDTLLAFREPAEIFYEPGLNVDSIDKVSPVPRLLFVPEKNISEFNMLWGGHSFNTLSVTALPDKEVESFKKQIAEKRNQLIKNK